MGRVICIPFLFIFVINFNFYFKLIDEPAQIKSVIPELTKGPELELKFSSNTIRNHGGVARSLLQSTMPKGRLLTPEEGCGYSEVQNKRIVGGAPAKNGQYISHLFILSRTPSFSAILIQISK